MVTSAMGAAMMGPMYSLKENGAQHGFRTFHLRLSTLQGSTWEFNGFTSSSLFEVLFFMFQPQYIKQTGLLHYVNS